MKNRDELFKIVSAIYPEVSEDNVAHALNVFDNYISQYADSTASKEKFNFLGLPPLPMQKLHAFKQPRKNDCIDFLMKHYGVWIRAGVMDWNYLNEIDPYLARVVKSRVGNNGNFNRDGPKGLLEIFPRASEARENQQKIYDGKLAPSGVLRRYYRERSNNARTTSSFKPRTQE